MNLEKQIGNINFSFMENLYKNSFSDEVIDVSKIDSLKCITSLTNNEKNLYEKEDGLNWTTDGSTSRIVNTYQCENEDCKYLYVGKEQGEEAPAWQLS